jgi:tetratricopeptide (TPR) repeat protein
LGAGPCRSPSGLQCAFNLLCQELANLASPFQTQLVIDTDMTAADPQTKVADTQTIVAHMNRKASLEQEGTPSQKYSVGRTCYLSAPECLPSLRPKQGQRYRTAWGSAVLRFHSISIGELPPPAPMVCFGRYELIEKVVGLAEDLNPIALVGAGGIGKTSIALTVLHHNRIKERFGENRRFLHCGQFPASRAHFLTRLSKIVGAGVENPEDMAPLRPFLSSKEMFIILDSAESILDPAGVNAKEICSAVDELCAFETICLLITSRVTTVPLRCERPKIPTLSMEAACNIFYDINSDCERSNVVNDLMERLDFHALSIKLLATTASHNGWDHDRLANEWDAQRTEVLQTDNNKSLAATIELSLASPTFCSLGPNGRDLLGVVAFFPQGIAEKNLDWLFSSISNSKNIFDRFCALSLTYRSNGFITMLAPFRDYLRPRDPQSSPLLCATRDRYFNRLSIQVYPAKPEFEETKWIMSEDVNVEHLLDVFAAIDPDGSDVLEACYHFMDHLYWHKPRQTILGLKIEALPDDHRHKPKCLSQLSRLFRQVGDYSEQKRLLTRTLELERQREDDSLIARTLRQLSDVNRNLTLYAEGIQQAKEALEIYRRIGDTTGQMECSDNLAWLLFKDQQLDAAEDVASHAIDLVTEQGQELLVCQLHRILGNIYRSKREKMKAVFHLKTAIKIATPFGWHDVLFWNNFDLASFFHDEGEFDEANVHIGQAKFAVNDAYKQGRAMELQAQVWYLQLRLEEARSEASHALEIHERLGTTRGAGACKDLLKKIEQAFAKPVH